MGIRYRRPQPVRQQDKSRGYDYRHHKCEDRHIEGNARSWDADFRCLYFRLDTRINSYPIVGLLVRDSVSVGDLLRRIARIKWLMILAGAPFLSCQLALNFDDVSLVPRILNDLYVSPRNIGEYIPGSQQLFV